MVTIEFRTGPFCNNIYVSAKGHADYNPGNDIVCAAVSAVLQTLEAWVQDSDKAAVLELEKQPGDYKLAYEAKSIAAFEPARAAYLGLLSLSKSYPDHVCVKFCEKIF